MHTAGQGLLVARPLEGTRRRRLGGRRRVAAGFAVLAAMAVAVTAVVAGAFSGSRSSSPPSCTVSSTTGSGSYSLSPDQAQNAAIIAAIAYKKGLPDHAVTVALATALQESKLQNLSYGDLDSVGLFQQRPSQGWGSRSQILDPIYATTAFYDHLVLISGWQSMAVTVAAQMVQHSADPNAYAAWEDEARALAIALTGESVAALSCHLASFGGSVPAPSALSLAAQSEMGADLIGVPVSTKVGWQVASWAVAHAYNYHVTSVAFGGRLWSVHHGTWSAAPASVSRGAVSVT